MDCSSSGDAILPLDRRRRLAGDFVGDPRDPTPRDDAFGRRCRELVWQPCQRAVINPRSRPPHAINSRNGVRRHDCHRRTAEYRRVLTWSRDRVRAALREERSALRRVGVFDGHFAQDPYTEPARKLWRNPSRAADRSSRCPAHLSLNSSRSVSTRPSFICSFMPPRCVRLDTFDCRWGTRRSITSGLDRACASQARL